MNKTPLHLEEVVHEPAIDICHLPNFLNAIPTMKSSRNREYVLIDKLFVNVLTKF